MVDLVKVRKKAKEKKEKEKENPGPQTSGPRPQEDTAGLIPHPSSLIPQIDKIQRFLETAGQRRALKKAVADEKPPLELLLFAIAGERYASNIEHIVEIVAPRPVTRIPNADPSVVGIFSLRGLIVTLIDVRRRLGHRAGGADTPETRVIVVQQNDETVGFLVDQVFRVVKTDSESIDPQPVAHASEHVEAVSGVFRHDDALTILLDLEKLLGGVAGWN